MPKLNTNVQLSPTEATLQDDPTVAEDELEAGSDDERTAEYLNSGLGSGKKMAHKDAQPNGMIRKFTRLFGIGGRPIIEETVYTTKGPDNGNIGQVGKAADREKDAELGGPTVVDSSNNGNGGQDVADVEGVRHVRTDCLTFPTHMKRKRDIYDVSEAHPKEVEEDGEVEEPPQKSFKNPRTSKKAKPPIVSPKRSKAPIKPQRQTRGNTRAASTEPESEMNPPISSPAGANSAVPSLEPPKKRSRGRPSKNLPVVPEDSRDLPEVAQIGRSTKQHVVQPADDDDEGIEDGVQGSTVAEDGINSILMNPSPVKPIPVDPPKSQRFKPAQRLQKQSGTGPLSGDLAEFSDLVDEPEDEEQVPENAPAPEDEADREDELPKILKDIIPVADLEEMLETARRVGQKQNKETKKWETKRAETVPRTVPGKRMLRRLERLIKAYSALQTARADGNESAANTAQIKVAAMIEALTEEAKVVFTETFGNPAQGVPYADTQSTHDMLIDVYFILVPNLVAALKLGVGAHQDEEFSKTEALEEIFGLLDLLRQLAEGAVRQRQASQPKASKNKQYRISFPTRSILPAIRIAHKSLAIELRIREHAKKTAAWNSGAADRERKLAAEAERVYEEKRRQRNEIYRMQQEVIDAKLKHPLYGAYLQAELEREVAKAQQRIKMQGARSSLSRPYRNSQRSNVQEVDEDDDDDIEDDPSDGRYERIKVFPNNNASKYRGPNPLSREEKVEFIEVMQFDEKEVRYENAAGRLGRSLEEIFVFAKELQDSFDLAHEKGEMNLPCDEWTYDVFIEQP